MLSKMVQIFQFLKINQTAHKRVKYKPSGLKFLQMVDSDPYTKFTFEQTRYPSKFLMRVITILISFHAVRIREITNACMLTKYVSQCSEIFSTHSGFVIVSIRLEQGIINLNRFGR